MRGNNNLKKRKVHPEESKELTAPQDDVDALFSDIEREIPINRAVYSTGGGVQGR